MTIDFTHGDDLSDLLGNGPRVAAPADESFARIRAMADQAPAAKAFQVPCKKCGGRGRFISYAGRDCGPCYTCKGKGSFERKNSATTLAANRQKAADRKVRQAEQNVELVREMHPAELAWLEAQAARATGNFAEIVQSALEAVAKYGELSAGRLAMAQRGIARDAERVQERQNRAAQQQEAVKGINVANIVECFQRAQEAGLKTFTLRFDGVHFQADKSEAGLIWVSASGYGSAKLGMIKGGVYRPGRDFTAEIGAKIELISADPMAAARAYAQVTRNCSVCGRHLENEVSVDAGIGPICSGRLGYKPGKKFVEVKDGDF